MILIIFYDKITSNFDYCLWRENFSVVFCWEFFSFANNVNLNYEGALVRKLVVR